MLQPANLKSGSSYRSPMKRISQLLFKIMMTIITLILLFIATVYTVNLVSSHSEQKRLERYGQQVSVDGKQMNVFMHGEGKETIVLLPGFGTASPVLDFKPLISELSPYYRVVVIEPFGYGLSDQTDKERSSTHITNEIHSALQSLGIDRYMLMAHSISGLYSLDYVNRYRHEVQAFIGLDHSVPTLSEQKVEKSDIMPIQWFRNLGFARVQLKLTADPYEGLPYDEKSKEQLNILIRKNMYNNTQLNEAVSMYSNFQAAKQLTWPADLPVLLFVQKNHPVVHEWVTEHKRQIQHSEYGKIVLLEANHYLYRSHSLEIATKIKEFAGSRL
ncbi:pimeloyl-ACP methyl ester carboxylesterase [Paenibacillus barcinonensis]|uniref:Pimeloyl-ACP methyl ester carboxylesterase n=4 Tax=Paenibacillus barcinonensis TaxID=198119 RepID=A0A2V4WKT8_PAEBA|nr:pimeloyl-ACP methyl ester carboxylesterase [Paenibacillus barcinonensis]